jgi:hypothetical protein
MKFLIYVSILFLSLNVYGKDKHKNDIPEVYKTDIEPCYFSTYKIKENWKFYVNRYGDSGFTHPGCIPVNYCDYECKQKIKELYNVGR